MPKQAGVNIFIEDGLKDQVTPMNNPTCDDCNECCSMGTMITLEEFRKLKRFMKTDRYGKYLYAYAITIVNEHLNKGVIYWMCPFSHNKRCRIYNKRPRICRDFHCDDIKCQDFRNKLSNESHKTIADLFRKDTFDAYKKALQNAKTL